MKRIACLLMLCVIGVVHADEDTLFQPADLTRIADLSDPALSHDGNWVAYTVSSANVDDDQSHSDLWRVRYDGSQRTQLTHTRDSNEWQPRWSNDGAWIAFLSNRPPDADESGDDATTQVWLMPADGGEARRLTDFADGVEDFVWSPDAKQLAVIAIDPEFPADAEKPKNPPPIVTERYQFKEDGAGYLDARRKHLYLFDIASGKAELLT
ncbi:MAG: PD40 domain-containing protein, partial [Xanthomonadales bacterium]|nr:PD40 domain-containing protein [Xanthomonadales bacterium]